MRLIQGFKSLNAAQRMFFISASISSFYTIYLLYNFVYQVYWSVIFSSITLISSYIYLSYYACYPNKFKIGDCILLFLTFITVFHLPSHFLATSRYIYQKELKDDILIKIDKIILGWLIKDGQISLYIDKNNFLGPHTTFGKFLNNFLQIFYFYYYIIPYITMHFISLTNCGKEVIFRFQNNGRKSISYTHRWSKTHFVFGAYLFTCILVFFINSLVPASSPRKYLSEEFIHPLNLTGFAKYLNKKCKDNKSANSFPSGHVAEILSIGLSYVLTGKHILGGVVIFFSFLIASATLFLRYHYFCDVIAAIICAVLSLIINYFFGYRNYLKKERKTLVIKDSNKSLGIINVNINIDSAQKENNLDVNNKKDKNHVELIEENNPN
jgi:hypothetical protein